MPSVHGRTSSARLVDGHGQHRESEVAQLVVQGLPPGQVVAAASPAGEGDEQLLLTAATRRDDASTPSRSARANGGAWSPSRAWRRCSLDQRHGHQPGLGVHHGEAAEGAGHRRQVEAAVDEEGGAITAPAHNGRPGTALRA